MPSKVGLVTALDKKMGKTGQPYYRVQVNGTWFSYFSPVNFNKGDTIEFDIVQKGTFQNMVNASPASAATAQAGASVLAGPTNDTRESYGDKEDRIMRQNAFSTAAVIVAASSTGSGKKDVREVLEAVKVVAKEVFEVNKYGYGVSPATSEGNAARTGFFEEDDSK